MLSRCALAQSSWRQLTLILAGTIWILHAVLPAAAVAQADLNIVRVEEDWELVVADADPALAAPQVTCSISPSGGIDGVHAAIELNYRSQPSFAAGGLQLQVWNGDQLIVARSYTNNSPLANASEQIRWTQSLTLTGSNVVFEVINGSSTTWGVFGGQGYLKATIQSTLPNLNGYHPNVSVEQSGVAYAGNRVQSLTLKEVRLITASGTILRDSTPRVVHQH